MEQTVVIIKPDVFVIEKRDEYSQLKKDLPSAEIFITYVQGKIADLNLIVINERKEQLSEKRVAEHYKEHKNNITKFNSILGNMTFGPSYILLVEGNNAQNLIRDLIIDIREEFLITPKGARRNMIHASGNQEEAIFETQLHFGEYVK